MGSQSPLRVHGRVRILGTMVSPSLVESFALEFHWQVPLGGSWLRSWARPETQHHLEGSHGLLSGALAQAGSSSCLLVFSQRLLQEAPLELTFLSPLVQREPFQGLPDRSRCHKCSRTLPSLILYQFASWV